VQKWCVLFSVGIFILLANLDMTIVNLALAVLSKDFLASIQQVQWIIVSYLMAAALFFCFFGKLADHFGKKNIFLLGCFLFVASSLFLGVWASNIYSIIFARFIQGLGFAATLGLAVVLIVRAFPINQKGLASGLAVTLSGIGLALGPPLGGFILQNFNWRWIFLLNVPLGILSIILTCLFVVKDKKTSDTSFKVDIISTAFYFLGLLTLILLLNSINKLSFIQLMGGIFLALLSIIIFVWRSLHVTAPLINVSLLKNRTYSIIIIIRMLFMWVMASFLFVLPLYLQNILGYSESDTGLWLLSMTGSIAVLAPFIGKLVDSIGYKIPIIVSIILLLLSCLIFINLQATVSVLFIAGGLAIFGLSNGMHTSSTINGAISQVSLQNSGTAIGLFFTIAMVGSMFGVVISGLILDSLSHIHIMNMINTNHLYLSAKQLEVLFSMANGSQSLNNWHNVFSNFPADFVQKITSESFIFSLHRLMLLNLIITFSGILLSLLLFKKNKTSI